MNKLRKQKIKAIFKLAYQDKFILIDGLRYDLSLIWSILEDYNPDVIPTKELLQILSKDVVKMDISSSRVEDYPILIHNNRLVDGEDILMNNVFNNIPDTKVIFLDEINLFDALME
jgi:hypothetical protein